MPSVSDNGNESAFGIVLKLYYHLLENDVYNLTQDEAVIHVIKQYYAHYVFAQALARELMNSSCGLCRCRFRLVLRSPQCDLQDEYPPPFLPFDTRIFTLQAYPTTL